MRNQWTLVAAAAILACGSLSRTGRAQNDPRIDGIMPHQPVTPDMSFLADPRTAKPAAGGRPANSQPATGPEVADTTSYPIKLDRPLVAGQSYDVLISSDATHKEEVTPAGAATPTVDSKQTKVEISGRMAVVAVDKLMTTEFNLTVTKFTVDGKEAVPANKVINAKFDKTYTFTIASGEALSAEAQQALHDAFGDSGDSDPFSTDTPHKVGESWKIDTAAAVQVMAKQGLAVDPANVTGTATLKGVDNTGASKSLRIEMSINAKNIKPSDPSQGSDASEMTITVSALYPVDQSMPPAEVSGTVDMHKHMTVPSAKDITEHDVHKETITPVK